MKASELLDGLIVRFPIPGQTMRGIGKVEFTHVVVRDAWGYERQVAVSQLEPASDTSRLVYWFDRCMKAEDDLAFLSRPHSNGKASDPPTT